MNNYIPDVNKFQLDAPPRWWLQKLWDFDASLVVVPSRQASLYRICQRRTLNLPERVTNDALFNESDTHVLATYSLIPVTSMKANPNWSNPEMFEELRRRAPHRMGGAEKFIAEIEAQEAKEEMDRRASIDDITESTARDGWGMYLKKLGVRSHMYIPKTKAYARRAQPASRAPAIKIAK